MDKLYNTVFKRRSVRKFDKKLTLTKEELDDINAFAQNALRLDDSIKIAFKTVKREETTAKFGEYCLLLYSEKKPFYLLNAGYVLEQLDLYLQSQNIGACWYGLAKPREEKHDGLDYVIMLAFGKSSPQDFRFGAEQFDRKSTGEISAGTFNEGVRSAVRLAPSACNSQPWRIEYSAEEIKVYRETRLRTIIPAAKRTFFNSIDMGICLCFLEISLMKKGIPFTKTLYDEPIDGSTRIHIATYAVKPAV